MVICYPFLGRLYIYKMILQWMFCMLIYFMDMMLKLMWLVKNMIEWYEWLMVVANFVLCFSLIYLELF